MQQDITVEALAKRCQEETDKYYRKQENDSSFCFELFRRALQDQDAEAFMHLHRIYGKQVLRWVRRSCRDEEAREHLEDFTQEVFTSIYQHMRRHKNAFDKFASVASLLAYMKTTSFNVVRQYYRKRTPIRITSIDQIESLGKAQKFLEEIRRLEVWARVQMLLHHEKYILLASYIFVLGLKHEEIVLERPDLWNDTRQVSIDLYAIKKILRADADLRSWVSNGAEDE